MRKMYSKNQIENIAKDAAGLPEIESGDAGKVLTVNESETGVAWVEGGKKLYEHNVYITAHTSQTNYKMAFSMRFINDSNTALTTSTVADALYNLYTNKSIEASGGAWVSTDDPITYYPIAFIQCINATPKRIDVYHVLNSGTIKQAYIGTIDTVQDYVREL